MSRGNVVRPVLGDYDQMRVWDSVTVHDHANALGLEVDPHPSADALCHHHYVRGDGVVNIREVIDVLPWDDRALAGSEWPQSHKCEADIVLANQANRRSSIDNLTKDAGHFCTKGMWACLTDSVQLRWIK
jgi:hypothetical protein